jgi:hypothetical protein
MQGSPSPDGISGLPAPPGITYRAESCLSNVSWLLSRSGVYNWQAYFTQIALPDACVLPGSGRVGRAHVAHLPSRDGCVAPLDGGAGGRWITPTVWAPWRCPTDGPMQTRHYTWLDRSDILQCLKGGSLLFEGDSLTREVYLRLIWWLRGLPSIAEHNFHRDSTFLFDKESDSFEFASDDFTTFRPRGYQDIDGSTRTPLQNSSLVQRLSTLAQRGGSVASVNNRSAMLAFRQFGRGGLGHALLRQNHAGAPLRGFVVGNLSQFTITYRHRRSGVIRVEKLSLDAMNAGGGAPHFFGRNFLAVGEARAEKARSTHTFPEAAFAAQPLPEQIAHGHAVGPGMERYILRHDDAHFQCQLEPRYPAQVVSFLKMPMNGDCRDMLSLNAAQAFLARMCSGHT